MEIKGLLVFDMDGTLVDFYGVPNWLEYLKAESVFPYAVAKPLTDLREMAFLLSELQKIGYKVAVTTWLAKEAERQYKKEITAVKRQYLDAYDFPYDSFHAVQYGTCKRYPTSPRKKMKGGSHYPERQFIFDDNEEVCEDWLKWYGAEETIKVPDNDILAVLRELLESEGCI